MDVQPVSAFNITDAQMLKGCIDPSGPTFLTYSPNGKQLVTAGSNNVVRVYETGSDGEPTNLDDCQENNTAIAATVSFGAKGGLETEDLYENRMTSFLRALRMVRSACTRSTHSPMRRCSHVALCPFVTSPSPQMANGPLLPASGYQWS